MEKIKKRLSRQGHIDYMHNDLIILLRGEDEEKSQYIYITSIALFSICIKTVAIMPSDSVQYAQVELITTNRMNTCIGATHLQRKSDVHRAT